jgi:hypothetical protein
MTNMNNTKTLAIVAVLTAATLVVGATFAASSTAFAFKKGNEGSKDGNTITAQINAQKGYVSGFDNSLEQEASNVICTHPSDECVSEGD